MVVVQKFGGTCLDTEEKRQMACTRIKDALDQGYQVLAVVSAMGRLGEPYATDTLISLARNIYPEVAPRELDLLLSCGEIISSVLMVQELRKRGIPALALGGGQAGILTDTNFGDASILAVDATHVRRHLDEGKVIVVAGFQGRTESGDITTLGRGGSDTTASVLGAALSAAYVEIYTDVNGVMTADPKIVESARTIPVVSYDEVSYLAWEGAKVIHPRACEIAKRAQIPLWIRSLSQDGQKTLITNDKDPEDPWVQVRNGKPVTGVTHKRGVTLFSIDLPIDEGMGITAQVFSALKDVNLDMITVSSSHISFIVSDDDALEVENALKGARVQPKVKSRVAKVTSVGYGMHGQPGIMNMVTKALSKENIQILSCSDSNVTISCLIHESDLKNAVKALHNVFLGDGGKF